MKTILTTAALVAAVIAAPASAQIAVADLDAAVNNAAALQAARAQIKTTFKAQIDAYNARQTALANQINPLRNELETLSKNSATPKATLEAKEAAYRTQVTNAQKELQALTAPFNRPDSFAQAQLTEKLSDAVKAVMTAKGVKVLLNPEAALAYAPDANITNDITAQLNTLLPSVSITPPAGWQQGQPTTAAPAAAKGR